MSQKYKRRGSKILVEEFYGGPAKMWRGMG